MSSGSQFGALTSLDGVTPVLGNIALTSSNSSITITPGVGTIDLIDAGGGGGGITTIDGDTGHASGTTITLTGGTSGAIFTGDNTTNMTMSFNNINLPNSSYTSQLGIISINNSPFISAAGGTGNGNTIVGFNAGGTNNDGGAPFQVEAQFNSLFGTTAGQDMGQATNNCAFGYQSLLQLIDGNGNVAIGSGAGLTYTAAESNNICIGSNTGVMSESNTIHIGDGGGVTTAYIGGIFGNTPSGTAQVAYVDTNGLLSSAAASPGGIKTWTDVATGTQALAANGGYNADNGASLVTFSLPSTAPIGSLITITGISAGLWTIAQAAGQQINFISVSTTSGTGGSLSSTERYDSVQLVCVVANTIWNVLSSCGNLTVV